MRDRIILWPIYFDSHASRKWRKVPKSMAVSNPSIEEIFKVAKKLGLNPLKEEKAHPARWWQKEGCISLKKTAKKTEIIRKIAEVLKQSRASFKSF